MVCRTRPLRLPSLPSRPAPRLPPSPPAALALAPPGSCGDQVQGGRGPGGALAPSVDRRMQQPAPVVGWESCSLPGNAGQGRAGVQSPQEPGSSDRQTPGEPLNPPPSFYIILASHPHWSQKGPVLEWVCFVGQGVNCSQGSGSSSGLAASAFCMYIPTQQAVGRQDPREGSAWPSVMPTEQHRVVPNP